MYTESILHRLGRAVRGFLLGISAWPPPLLHKRGWQMATLRFSASFYVALRRRRVVYGLAVDTKGITTVARNSPIAFGWCTTRGTSSAWSELPSVKSLGQTCERSSPP